MDVKAKTAGPFYRDEAARLVSAAAEARKPQPPAPVKPASYAAPVLDEPARPPLTPEPPTNQNRRAAPRPAPEPRTRGGLPRLLARIVIAPLYLGVAAAALGVIVLFARGFF